MFQYYQALARVATNFTEDILKSELVPLTCKFLEFINEKQIKNVRNGNVLVKACLDMITHVGFTPAGRQVMLKADSEVTCLKFLNDTVQEVRESSFASLCALAIEIEGMKRLHSHGFESLMKAWRKFPCKIAIKCLQNISHLPAFRLDVVKHNLAEHALLENLYGAMTVADAFKLVNEFPEPALKCILFFLQRPMTAAAKAGGSDVINMATKMSIPVGSTSQIMYEHCVDVLFDGIAFDDHPDLVLDIIKTLCVQDNRFIGYYNTALGREGDQACTTEWREAVGELMKKF